LQDAYVRVDKPILWYTNNWLVNSSQIGIRLADFVIWRLFWKNFDALLNPVNNISDGNNIAVVAHPCSSCGTCRLSGNFWEFLEFEGVYTYPITFPVVRPAHQPGGAPYLCLSLSGRTSLVSPGSFGFRSPVRVCAANSARPPQNQTVNPTKAELETIATWCLTIREEIRQSMVVSPESIRTSKPLRIPRSLKSIASPATKRDQVQSATTQSASNF